MSITTTKQKQNKITVQTQQYHNTTKNDKTKRTNETTQHIT